MSTAAQFPISMHAATGMAADVRATITMVSIMTTRKRDGSG